MRGLEVRVKGSTELSREGRATTFKAHRPFTSRNKKQGGSGAVHRLVPQKFAKGKKSRHKPDSKNLITGVLRHWRGTQNVRMQVENPDRSG